MKKKFRAREVSVETKNISLLTPSALAAVARSTQPLPRYACVGDFVEAIVELRHNKNFTWREISEWLNARGVPNMSVNNVCKVYRRWSESREQATA